MKQEIPVHAFVKLSAVASWIVAILAVGILILSDLTMDPSSAPTRSVLIVTFVVFLLAFGVVLGIIGLIGRKKYGISSHLVSSILGVSINGVLLCLISFVIYSEFQSMEENTSITLKEVDTGTFYGTTYHNSYFGLSITMPADWKIQDIESEKRIMRDALKASAGEDEVRQKRVKEIIQQTVHLFSVFKYPFGTTAEFNPGIACVAENLAQRTGITKGGEYLEYTKKLMGFSGQELSFPKEIYTVMFDNVPFDVLLVKKPTGEVTVNQEYYATIINGYALGFIVNYTKEEDKKILMETLDSLMFHEG